jgi:hypothetical protein
MAFSTQASATITSATTANTRAVQRTSYVRAEGTQAPSDPHEPTITSTTARVDTSRIISIGPYNSANNIEGSGNEEMVAGGN